FFFFQAEDGIRDFHVTGVQTCALPIYDKGIFELSNLSSNDQYNLYIRHVSFLPDSITGFVVKANRTNSLLIRLKSRQATLDEVVVVGYVAQRRSEVTSAIASVKKDSFIKGAVQDVAQLLQGKVA